MSVYVDSMEFVTVTPECCGTTFGMPEWFYDKTKREGLTWYCPQGHSRIWIVDTEEKKRKKAEARAQHLEEQLEAAVEDAERTRHAMVKDRQRFANGVCPCCDRSFQNVRRHMATQHPDYDIARVDQPRERRFRCSCGAAFESFRGLRIHQGHHRRPGWAAPSTSKWRAHLTEV